MNRKSYSATIDLFFDYNNIREKIPSENIVYVLVESNYDNDVLPIIYISLSVDSNMYTKIIKYKSLAKFYLNIKKINKNSISSISKNAISGSFSYIPSTTNPNYTEDLSNATSGDSYKRIMLGLVSIELTNTLRKSFNNIYNNINTDNLISLALEGTNYIAEKITYNTHYNSILVPPLTSRYRLLEFIFNSDPFYDTKFRYFMDFERSYLLSKSGNSVDSGDGQLSSIIVDIRSITENEAYYDGIEVKNDAYYVYINPVNSNVTLEQGIEKVANQIVAVDEDKIEIVDLDINKTEGSDTKQMFIRTDNVSVYKNELETNTIIVEIVKQHIDGSIFTPNKCISINNYGEYSKYNGKYIMIYKREFYKCVAGEFVMSCNVGLRRIGNLNNSKSTSATSSSAIKKSTSNNKNTSRLK